MKGQRIGSSGVWVRGCGSYEKSGREHLEKVEGIETG